MRNKGSGSRYTKNRISASAFFKIDYKNVKKIIQEVLKLIKETKNKDKDYYLKLGKLTTELMNIFGFKTIINNEINIEPILSLTQSSEKFAENLFKNGNQFDFESEKSKNRTLEDIVANVMYLSNQFAHHLEENFNEISSIKKLDSKPISGYFFNIKDECIDELLRLRDSGRPILIGKSVDNSVSSRVDNVYNFALPGYLQTFTVHGEQGKDDYSFDTSVDFIRFSTKKRTKIPFRLGSKDLENIKKQFEQGMLNNIIKKDNKKKFELFLKVQDRFQPKEKRNQRWKKNSNSLYTLKPSKMTINNVDRILKLDYQIQEDCAHKRPKKLVETMYSIIDGFNFWERLAEDENKKVFNYLSNIVDKGVPSDMIITKEQISEQFNPNRKQEVPELMANGMILADTILELIENSETSLNKKKYIRNTFSSVRNYFQEELIRSRNGERGKILIGKELSDSTDRNNDFRTILHICIPGYMGIFSTILPKKDMEPLKFGNDLIPFSNEEDRKRIHVTFPIKATDKQKEIFKALAKRKDLKLLEKARTRVDFFNNVDEIFESQNKKKAISKPTTLSGKSKIIKPKTKGDIKNSNREFLDEQNERIDNLIPRSIIKEINERSAYSLRDVYENKMKPIIKKELSEKGYPEGLIDSESNLVFLYMRMCKPLSTIRLLGKNNPSLTQAIKQSIDEYEIGFEVIDEYFKKDRGTKKLSGLRKAVSDRLKEEDFEKSFEDTKENRTRKQEEQEYEKAILPEDEQISIDGLSGEELIKLFKSFNDMLNGENAKKQNLASTIEKMEELKRCLESFFEKSQEAGEVLKKLEKIVNDLDGKNEDLQIDIGIVARLIEKYQEMTYYGDLSQKGRDAKLRMPEIDRAIKYLKAKEEKAENRWKKLQEIDEARRGEKR